RIDGKRRTECGSWFFQAAKTSAADGNIRLATSWFKKAVSLGVSPWYLHQRIELLSKLSAGHLSQAPTVPIIGSLRNSGNAHEVMAEIRRIGRLGKPEAEIDVHAISNCYAVGVYRWQGDHEASAPLSRMIRRMKDSECLQATEAL